MVCLERPSLRRQGKIEKGKIIAPVTHWRSASRWRHTRFLKKFQLCFIVAVVVPLLSGVKTDVHYRGIELLDLNSLFTSGIGGAIFIVGFLPSNILADHKEAE